MALEQPSAGNSSLLAGLLFLITLSGLEIWAPKLASTPQLTIVGGFISSLLFFFGVICIGNLEKEIGWPEVIAALLVAEVAAGTVHRVCVTSCFLFSIALGLYLNYMARNLYQKPLTDPTLSLKKSR